MFLRPLLLALAMTGPVLAQDATGRDWHLLALDGQRVAPGTTLRLEADGSMSGRAPCNSYGTQNTGALPALALRPIRATRMACPRLDEEQAFFDALAVMTTLDLSGPDRLILSGPDGRVMEFVPQADLAAAGCETCPPTE
jgi:heat shock protein HslJ